MPIAGDQESHETLSDTYTPGIIASQWHPGIQQHPQDPARWPTRWYVIGNDNQEAKKCRIRLVHDYTLPEKQDGGKYFRRCKILAIDSTC